MNRVQSRKSLIQAQVSIIVKKALTLALLVLSFPISAAASEYQCPIEVDSELELTAEALTITQEDSVLRLANGVATIDGTTFALDAEQAAAAQAYEAQVRQTVPPLVDLVSESLRLATVAIKGAFTSFYDGNPPADLIQAYDDLEAGVGDMVSRDGDNVTVRYGVQESMERIEPLIAGVVSESVAAMTTSLISLVFSSERDMASLTADAEALTQQIESELAEREAYIEQKADILCREMTALEASEDALHALVPEFEPWQITRMK